MNGEIKLVRFLQQNAGLSRRKASEKIIGRKVSVDGSIVDQISFPVSSKNLIVLEGKKIVGKVNVKKPEIVMFYKPKGYVVSNNDKHNKTIFDIIPERYQKGYYYVGRLDKDSHGLLLLTNESALVNYYENPKSKIEKGYEVVVTKRSDREDYQKMKDGLWIDEHGKVFDDDSYEGAGKIEFLDAVHVKYRNDKGKHVLYIVLNSGKKRHIRRLLRAFDIGVVDLKRVKFADFRIVDMKRQQFMTVAVPYKAMKAIS